MMKRNYRGITLVILLVVGLLFGDIVGQVLGSTYRCSRMAEV